MSHLATDRRLRFERLERRVVLNGTALVELAAALDNQAPQVADPIADFTVDEDAPDTTLDLAAVFQDADLAVGESLTYTVEVATPAWSVADQISEETYTRFHQDDLYTHAGDNRGIGGAEHDLARDNIFSHFQELGLETSLHAFTYQNSTYYNVVGVKPGVTRPDEIFVLGAHYDSVYNAGADDNGSGTAAVMEAARVLAEYEFDCTVTFIAFDREEQGMKGSYAYVADHAADNILGVVNLDMIAYNPAGANHDKVLLYEYRDGGHIKQDLIVAINLYGGGLTAVDAVENMGRSDHQPFELRGFDAALVIEHEVWSNPHYHQLTDAVETPNYIDYTYATSITSAATGYLAGAAGLTDANHPAAAVVEGDLLELDYGDDRHGTVEIVVRATDPAGLWVEDTFTVIVEPVADVLGRHVFYNQSKFDGDSAEANSDDDGAIAPDKTALRSGQRASLTNYTSYSRGINGIMIDVADAEAPISAADFLFHVGNDGAPHNWAPAPAGSVTVRHGEGVGNSDRVTVVWPDGAVRNEWLQVTVLGDNLGLADDDIFYFGNAVAETGNSPDLARVTIADLLLARNNPRGFGNPAGLDSRHDYNRDDRVDSIDVLLARNNHTTFLDELQLIDLSAEQSVAPEAWDLAMLYLATHGETVEAEPDADDRDATAMLPWIDV